MAVLYKFPMVFALLGHEIAEPICVFIFNITGQEESGLFHPSPIMGEGTPCKSASHDIVMHHVQLSAVNYYCFLKLRLGEHMHISVDGYDDVRYCSQASAYPAMSALNCFCFMPLLFRIFT